jgi:hypothetical protein
MLFVEDLPEQATFHPLHDHVNATAIFIYENLHHPGVIQSLSDLLLALKAIEQGRIALDFRMRDLDGDLAAIPQIGSAKNAGHSTAGDETVDAVVIKLIAGMQRGHR